MKKATDQELSAAEAYSLAAAYCSKGERCASDVEKYLKKKGCTETSEVINDLRREGFIDDRRYAAAFARDKAKFNGWGRARIRSELFARSIPAAAVQEALALIDSDAYGEKLAKLLAAKARSLRGAGYSELRQKCLNAAIAKGYEPGEAVRAFDELKDGFDFAAGDYIDDAYLPDE